MAYSTQFFKNDQILIKLSTYSPRFFQILICLDPNNPSTLSERTLKELLNAYFGFWYWTLLTQVMGPQS